MGIPPSLIIFDRHRLRLVCKPASKPKRPQQPQNPCSLDIPDVFVVKSADLIARGLPEGTDEVIVAFEPGPAIL
jgi:hypothetical protein